MPLSDTAIKNAKANIDKALKLTGEKGTYLPIHTNGSKYFRLDYRFDGKRKTLVFGTYQESTLKEAQTKGMPPKNKFLTVSTPVKIKKRSSNQESKV